VEHQGNPVGGPREAPRAAATEKAVPLLAEGTSAERATQNLEERRVHGFLARQSSWDGREALLLARSEEDRLSNAVKQWQAPKHRLVETIAETQGCDTRRALSRAGGRFSRKQADAAKHPHADPAATRFPDDESSLDGAVQEPPPREEELMRRAGVDTQPPCARSDIDSNAKS